ncbi:hypothetical protein CDD83_4036 [Cordyceps sp. RAO-2017]|nr:hypothetical protein CDD83_4036 [Cordyceps sp. RAO-2017]
MPLPSGTAHGTTTAGSRRRHGPAKTLSCHALRPCPSQPFDADELKRKLCLLLTEQDGGSGGEKGRIVVAAAGRAASDAGAIDGRPGKLPRRRDEDIRHGEQQPRKIKLHLTASRRPSGSGHGQDESVRCSSYRHIPQVAATQFALTTVVDGSIERQLLHRLSRPAIRYHHDGPSAEPEPAARPGAAPSEQARALRRAQSLRERQHERRHFHHSSALGTMVEADETQPACRHRHTFESYFKGKVDEPDGPRNARWRRSTGSSILGRPDPTCGDNSAGPATDGRARGESFDPTDFRAVDWTQSDEPWAAQEAHPLRKYESRWALRGRLGSLARHGKDEKSLSPPQEKRVAHDSPKPSRSGGLFSWLRR